MSATSFVSAVPSLRLHVQLIVENFSSEQKQLRHQQIFKLHFHRNVRNFKNQGVFCFLLLLRAPCI